MSDPGGDARRWTWTIGDYPTVARLILPISVETVSAIGIRPGDRVLDVGVGNGNAAIEAARLGALVTGIDLTPAQLELARARCAREGVEVDLREGDAECLDVADSSFDVVLSVMGMIFAPDHARAIAEMHRACRPGGTVAITTWVEGGWSTRWRERVSHLLPPPATDGPMPAEWGHPDEVVRRFATAGLHATVVARPFAFGFPSVDAAVDLFLRAAGPLVQTMEAASSLGHHDEFVTEFRAAMVEHNRATDGTVLLPAPYLLAVATP